MRVNAKNISGKIIANMLKGIEIICNFIPHAYEWFDMQDLACLIAPRKLSVVAGEKDEIFPIYGVKKGFESVKKIYEKAGAPENCSLTVTPQAHWWCEDIVWNVIEKSIKLI